MPPDRSDLTPGDEHPWGDLLKEHDQRMEKLAGPIWLGAEPTFADRFSWAPEWQTAALGPDKESRARRMIVHLAMAKPGSVILRSRGRQYPNEPGPRWSFGIYGDRHGRSFHQGPPDPLLFAEMNRKKAGGEWIANQGGFAAKRMGNGISSPMVGPSSPPRGLDRETTWANQVRQLAHQSGWHAHHIPPSFDSIHRILFSSSMDVSLWNWETDPRVTRGWLQSLDAEAITPSDTLADEGILLVLAGACPSDDTCEATAWQLELPGVRSCDHFRLLLEIVSEATARSGWEQMILTGYPPPVNESVFWTTITPDPGVLEVNMAPASSLEEFSHEQQLLHQAARSVGLESRQFLFNGHELDSGGGQHLTFGGASPESSPFFRHPLLLARLIAFLNHHPSLSYWFAGQSVGSSGQSPRVDEVTAEAVDGLSVALALLARQAGDPGDPGPPCRAGVPALSPEQLWSTLSPFLTDRFGNTHRSEVNIEKLWSPHWGDRGRLGLVELRAFRMLGSPEETVAVAMLLRSLLALLSREPEPLTLRNWGEELHDRHGLPHYLEQDLLRVLRRLDQAGLGIPDPIRATLLDDSYWLLADFSWEGATVQLRRGIEFWPLIGDHSLQSLQYATYRQVDASTARVEIRVHLPPEGEGNEREAGTSGEWEVGVEGYRVPLQRELSDSGQVLVGGVRFKAFQPQTTIFPLAPVTDPLHWEIRSPAGTGCRFAFHGWRPEGGEYDGLPVDAADARARRRRRLVIQPTVPASSLNSLDSLTSLTSLTSLSSLSSLKAPPSSALSPCCLDIRRLPLS